MSDKVCIWKNDLGSGKLTVAHIVAKSDQIVLQLAAPTPEGSSENTLLTQWIQDCSIRVPSGTGICDGAFSATLTQHPRFGRRSITIDGLSLAECDALALAMRKQVDHVGIDAKYAGIFGAIVGEFNSAYHSSNSPQKLAFLSALEQDTESTLSAFLAWGGNYRAFDDVTLVWGICDHWHPLSAPCIWKIHVENGCLQETDDFRLSISPIGCALEHAKAPGARADLVNAAPAGGREHVSSIEHAIERVNRHRWIP